MSNKKNNVSLLPMPLLLAGLGSLGVAFAGFFFLLLGAVVIATPTAPASWAWERALSWFGADSGWKNAVYQAANYRPPAGRENLLLYRPIWKDCPVAGTGSTRSECKPVPEDDQAHWLNYGKAEQIYIMPKGYHAYTFDIGRIAQLDEIYLAMACKNCRVQVVVSYDGREGEAAPLTAETIARYYSPTLSSTQELVPNPGKYAAAYKINSEATEGRFVTLVVNNQDSEAYFGQLYAFPPGKQSNALYASKPLLDGRYQHVHSARIGQTLSPPDPNPLAERNINTGNSSSEAIYSYYFALADAKSATNLPLYPVVGASSQSQPVAGNGTPADGVQGYYAVYLRFKLAPSTVGRLDEIGLSFANANSRATRWKVYLLDSTDSTDSQLLNLLFNTSDFSEGVTGDANFTSSPVALPAAKLLKEYDAGSVVGGSSSLSYSSGKLALPPDNKGDMLVFAFEQSSYTPGAGLAASEGLPPAWLSLAEVTAYEVAPALPTKWPKPATGSSSGGWFSSGSGAFDVRYGSVTCEKLEAILADHPFTGIGVGGLPADEPPKPNILTGKCDFFLQMGKKYNINPGYALLWAKKESSIFNTGVIVYNARTGYWGYNGYGVTYNPVTRKGGWLETKCLPNQPLEGADGKTRYFCGYASPEDAIEDWFALISEGYVGGQLLGGRYGPLVTVDQIVNIYAPPDDNNDTNLYAKQIKEWATSYGIASASNGGSSGSSGPVPAISQLDPAQYTSDYSVGVWGDSACGPASATMVINSLGYNFTIADLLAVAGPSGDVGSEAGTYRWNYISSPELGGRYGFTYRLLGGSSESDYLTQFKLAVREGQPVIANVKDTYYYGGHFFVVVAYDELTDTFTIHDPISRPISGQGVVQQWPATQLASILRVGLPAIVISKTGTPVA